MGNKPNKGGPDEFDTLPDSPTLRILDHQDFLLTVTKDPGRTRPEQLPKHVTFRLTPSHCEFWARDGEIVTGNRPLKAISYFNILGWGHSPAVFRMIESCEVVVQGGKMVKKRKIYEFFTRQGVAITEILSTGCYAIVTDIDTKKSEKRLVEKEKEWDEYWTSKEEDEDTLAVGSPVQECLSPLAGAEPNLSPSFASPVGIKSPLSPYEDLLCGSFVDSADCLSPSLKADIRRITSESPGSTSPSISPNQNKKSLRISTLRANMTK